jgi:hypothetical protein
MKNKTKLKKAGIVCEPHTPVYAEGTLIVDVRKGSNNRRVADKMTQQQGSKYMHEGCSAMGRSYHVKPSLFRQNTL